MPPYIRSVMAGAYKPSKYTYYGGGGGGNGNGSNSNSNNNSWEYVNTRTNAQKQAEQNEILAKRQQERVGRNWNAAVRAATLKAYNEKRKQEKIRRQQAQTNRLAKLAAGNIKENLKTLEKTFKNNRSILGRMKRVFRRT